MGSYNTSCFVTRQTIASGERCVVAPIVQQSTYSPVHLQLGEKTFQEKGYAHTACYSTRHWAPLTYFLQATYDDRGATAVKDSMINRFRLISFLGTALGKVPKVLAEGQYHRDAFDLGEFMDHKAPDLKAYLATKQSKSEVNDFKLLFGQAQVCLDVLQEEALRHRLFWEVSPGEIRPLCFAAMHGATYDALVDTIKSGRGHDGESMEMRPFFDRALKQALMVSKQAQEDCKTDPSIKTLGDIYVAQAACSELRDAMMRTGAPNEFRNLHETRRFDHHARSFFAGKIDADELFKQLTPWIESHYACSGLEVVNAHFEPMVYAGQDSSNRIGRNFERLVHTVSVQVTRENLALTYGEPNLYVMQVKDPAATSEIGRLVRQRDASWELVSMVPSSANEPVHEAEVLCTLPLHLMRQTLLDFQSQDGNAGRVLVETLRQVELTESSPKASSENTPRP